MWHGAYVVEYHQGCGVVGSVYNGGYSSNTYSIQHIIYMYVSSLLGWQRLQLACRVSNTDVLFTHPMCTV